jgi:hypothetical protein
MFAKYRHVSCRAPLDLACAASMRRMRHALLCLRRAGYDDMQAIIAHGIPPLIYVIKNLYREMTRAALTDVKISANEIAPYEYERGRGAALTSYCPA